MSTLYEVQVERCELCPGWHEGRNQCKVTGLHLYRSDGHDGSKDPGLPESCPLRYGRVELYTKRGAHDSGTKD